MTRWISMFALLYTPLAFGQDGPTTPEDASQDAPAVEADDAKIPAKDTSAAREASTTDRSEPDASEPETTVEAPAAPTPPAAPVAPVEVPAPAPPPAPKAEVVHTPTEAPVKAIKAVVKGTEFKVSGLYTAWGLTQQNFLLGRDHPLDDTQYVVQMLRTKVEAKKGKIGATFRLDAGQGWWGVNNSPNIADTTTFDTDGNPVENNVYNQNKLFGNKDTNYGIHVDRAYGWADFDLGGVPLHVQIGRQYFGVGNKLVLDQDYDGITATLKPEGFQLDLMWAKVSEGRGAFKNPTGLLMSDSGANGDGDLFGLSAKTKNDANKLEVFGLYYMDRSNQDDWTYLSNGVGYLRSRWQPNISSLLVVGAAANGRIGGDAKNPGLLYKAEGDFLVGKDDVANTDHVGGLSDINNGNLIGYNAYVNLTKPLDVMEGLELGAMFGMGSGDADKTSGAGNVNKLQTMGFFGLTNVWEDSVMPDVQGISPQGLGSPVSRGYRELENTIAAQGRISLKPSKPLKLDLSYTYLRATTPVQGFDAAGTPTGAAASDLGMEIDANVTIKFTNGLMFKSLGGVFIPGTASANLMNGNADNLSPAWEIKNVVIVKF